MIDSNNKDFDIRDKCVDRCLSLFNDIVGINDVVFEKVIGKSEEYFTAKVAYEGHIIDIYIYSDGAEFIVDDQFNPRFEWYEGVTENDLIKSFIQTLQLEINKIKIDS